jgi:hypothetical protein
MSEPHENRFGKLLFPVTRFTSSSGEIEVSAHQCGKPFLREIENVIPGIDSTALIAIPTMQHAREDLVKIGDNIEDEKDRLLETFMTFAKKICEKLIGQGYFADYVDPCSGLAMITKDSNKVYSEVDGAQQLLNYSVQNAGCCKILLHPSWSSAVYPATIFTTAPAEMITEELFRAAVQT